MPLPQADTFVPGSMSTSGCLPWLTTYVSACGYGKQDAARQAQQELRQRDQQLAHTRAELDTARDMPRECAAVERHQAQGREQAHNMLASKLDRLESDWR